MGILYCPERVNLYIYIYIKIPSRLRDGRNSYENEDLRGFSLFRESLEIILCSICYSRKEQR